VPQERIPITLTYLAKLYRPAGDGTVQIHTKSAVVTPGSVVSLDICGGTHKMDDLCISTFYPPGRIERNAES